MATPSAVSQRQFLVSIQGMQGYWAARSSGGLQAATTKEFDGGSKVPYVLTAPPLVEDLTVSRPFVPGRDDNLLTNLLTQVGSLQTTISQVPTDPNFAVNGGGVTWTGILSTVTPPDMNSNSNDGAMLTLVFTCTAVAGV